MNDCDLDVITIGRSSVDLYAQQVGTRLEDAQTFNKSVGGCPSNIAIGCARMGLRSAIITGVGDEPMGRFIVEQLEREGVDIVGVRVDPARLSALAILSVRDNNRFPLVFYRENCADMALTPDDIDLALIARTKSIVVTGTHFSRANTSAMQFKAIEIARSSGAKVIFDIDYRPNLWGLGGHNSGDERFVASNDVTAHLRPVLSQCDVIVGTEEELTIAGGSTDILETLRTIRAESDAIIVLKRGAQGCIVFDGPIPSTLEDGTIGAGFPIEVYNVLGAGDAFMSGFLRGYLRDEPLRTCCTYGNASGAMTVSRLMCSSEIPTFVEMSTFIENGSTHKAVRFDADLNQLHWSTTRRPRSEGIMALAIDHRSQLEAMADTAGVPYEKITAFKLLAVAAAEQVSNGKPGYGMLLDGTYGVAAMVEAEEANMWIGRPVEQPGSCPLEFEGGGDIGSLLVEWPIDHTVKCLCFMHPDDAEDLRLRQERELLRIFDATRRVGRELMIEIIASKRAPLTTDTTARVMQRLYQLGIKPDWWKLEPQPDSAAWKAVGDVVREQDDRCRGIIILGLDAPLDNLLTAFADASDEPMVRGFAVGRSIFGAVAVKWLAGAVTDADAITEMAERYGTLVKAWTQR